MEELPLKYQDWIRAAQVNLFARLAREGKTLDQYYFETQLGPVGIHVDAIEARRLNRGSQKLENSLLRRSGKLGHTRL